MTNNSTCVIINTERGSEKHSKRKEMIKMMKMGYRVQGYVNGEHMVGAWFDTYIEAKRFAKDCFADCKIFLVFNHQVVCEM